MQWRLLILHKNPYFLLESFDSGDTRTLTEATEEEAAKDDEIQPENDNPQFSVLDQKEETKIPTLSSTNGHWHSVQTRKPVIPHNYQWRIA